MVTALLMYILISYLLAMFRIIRNRDEFVATFEEEGYHEFSSFHKIAYIIATVCVSTLVIVPVIIYEKTLDS